MRHFIGPGHLHGKGESLLVTCVRSPRLLSALGFTRRDLMILRVRDIHSPNFGAEHSLYCPLPHIRRCCMQAAPQLRLLCMPLTMLAGGGWFIENTTQLTPEPRMPGATLPFLR